MNFLGRGEKSSLNRESSLNQVLQNPLSSEIDTVSKWIKLDYIIMYSYIVVSLKSKQETEEIL